MDENRKYFKELVKNIKYMTKDTYTSIEIIQYLKKMNTSSKENIFESSIMIENLMGVWSNFDKSELKYLITVLNSNIKKYSKKIKKINYSNKSLIELKNLVLGFINSCYENISENFQLLNEISMLYLNKSIMISNQQDVVKINNNFGLITNYITNVNRLFCIELFIVQKQS